MNLPLHFQALKILFAQIRSSKEFVAASLPCTRTLSVHSPEFPRKENGKVSFSKLTNLVKKSLSSNFERHIHYWFTLNCRLSAENG